jgi:uncharacterized protein DUF6353
MDFASLARRAAHFAANNSPTILTSVAVVGTISTAYLAGKASFRAAAIIQEDEKDHFSSEEDRRDTREVMKDRILLVWKEYIPAGIMLGGTLACIISANRVGLRRAAGMAAAYSILEKGAEEYKAKVVKILGEKKEEQIHADLAQDRVTRHRLEDVELLEAPGGELCFDEYNKRYFRSTIQDIRTAENDLNHSLVHHNYATLADFYSMLDLSCPAYSHTVGWSSDRLLEVRTTSALMDGDKPVIVMSFKNEPHPDYQRFH